MMEGQIFQIIALYFLYYIGIPALILLVIWKIKQKKDFIKILTTYGEKQTDESHGTLKKNNKKLKNLQVLLVILILISIPVLNLTFYDLQDISMHRTRFYQSGQTIYPSHIDLVEEKIGPTFDAEDAIERMEEAEYKDWYLDDIREQIDLSEIIRKPGRVTIYKLKSTSGYPERIVITNSYLSPIPITRSIEFTVIEGKAFLEADNLVVYPMPPTMVAPS